MRRLFEYGSLFFLVVSTVFLVGLQDKLFGWSLFFIGAVLLFFTTKQYAKDVSLVYFGIAVLGFTPISTSLEPFNFFRMGFGISLAVLVPYLVSRFVYRDHLIRFPFHHGRKWFKKEVAYVVGTLLLAYFLLPFYFGSTGAHLNWSTTGDFGSVFRLFLGTQGLGFWDELFFVSTVFGILKRFFPFHVANLAQSILFTSFLFELGFTGWGPLMIFPFAWVQGFIFRRTKSLLYILTIHLSLDLVLFFVLVNKLLGWFPWFVT